MRKLNNTAIPRDWLVWEWLLDWNAVDTSWSWNNWTATNVTWNTAERWYVKEVSSFNGNSDIIVNNNPFAWLFSVNVWINTTQSLWTYWTDKAYGWSQIINADVSGAANDIIPLSILEWYPVIWIWNAGWNYLTSSFSWNYQVNDWKYHMITMLRVPSSNTISLYIDWKYISSQTNNIISTNTNDQTKFRMWIEVPWNGSYFNWNIWLARIYNRVLNNSEIQALHQEGLKKLWPTNLLQYPELFEWAVWYWDFRNWNLSNLIDWTNATNNGTTSVTDHLGNIWDARNFDGISNWINLNHNFMADFWNNPSFSININWQFKTWNSLYKRYFWNYNYTAQICDFVSNWNDIPAFSLSDSNNVLIIQDISYPFVNNTWYNITLTREPNLIKIYVDWVLTNTNTTAQSWNYNSWFSHLLWRDHTWYYWISSISTFIIYNRALSASEVKTLYNLTSKKYIYPFAKYTLASLPKPILHIDWTNDWTTWYDQSGNGNNWTGTAITMSKQNQSDVMLFNWSSSNLLHWNYSITWSITITATLKWDWINQWWTNDWWTLISKWWYSDWEFTLMMYKASWWLNFYRWWWASIVSTWGVKALETKNTRIVAVYNWTTAKIYFNWVLIISNTITKNISANTQPITIWKNNTWNAYYLWWLLNDIQVYDQALTQEQIQQDYYSSYIN